MIGPEKARVKMTTILYIIYINEARNEVLVVEVSVVIV
jgi:hypothetical protein